MPRIKALATDLDGTLIPLADRKENIDDLKKLCALLHRHQMDLIFVTGRHFESVMAAIDQHQLPRPECMLCDVGTTFWRRSPSGYEIDSVYTERLRQIASDMDQQQVAAAAAAIGSLKLQEREKQGMFKLSFYLDSSTLDVSVNRLKAKIQQGRLPFDLVASVDPFNGVGLLDILPKGVSKAFGLHWWCEQTGLRHDQLIFAGDSGNDRAALASSHKAIVVANAPRTMAEEIIA
ncbi:MAG: HAD-IIB family hydrolase, partial [Planctomycetaceae bacterium]|nr:HAD-IIB family hydrolase [Planctomycetaceae bacterium]